MYSNFDNSSVNAQRAQFVPRKIVFTIGSRPLNLCRCCYSVCIQFTDDVVQVLADGHLPVGQRAHDRLCWSVRVDFRVNSGI